MGSDGFRVASRSFTEPVCRFACRTMEPAMPINALRDEMTCRVSMTRVASLSDVASDLISC